MYVYEFERVGAQHSQEANSGEISTDGWMEEVLCESQANCQIFSSDTSSGAIGLRT